jgi:polysaccharide export outer membrane protein
MDQIAPQGALTAANAGAQGATEGFILREGDAVRITFPGAPNLNTVQAIRRDGIVSLPLVGEVYAAGLSPKELEARLLELYGPQLQTKEVNVALESSAFTIYVIGAVLRPGKVVSTRPLSALEAVMEAGGFDFSRANMKNVRVIRYIDGKPHYFSVNLKKVMNGKGAEPFPIKPADILYVPERFVWF